MCTGMKQRHSFDNCSDDSAIFPASDLNSEPIAQATSILAVKSREQVTASTVYVNEHIQQSNMNEMVSR